jgi:vitamin B12 transporter
MSWVSGPGALAPSRGAWIALSSLLSGLLGPGAYAQPIAGDAGSALVQPAVLEDAAIAPQILDASSDAAAQADTQAPASSPSVTGVEAVDAASIVVPLTSVPPGVAVDVTVVALSKAQRERESARAVQVIELRELKRSTADMGQVLARNEGISVRRSGGIGSDARLSLNGLSDEQVRIFIDGVPLELAGYPFGLVNVPLELVDRVEVHRGVVPVRLGADSVGGAVELISDSGVRGTHANVSYQAGSFDTHRLLASARHRHASSGLFVRAEGFFDAAENDYPIDVDLMDARGLARKRVRRNRDAYRARFGSIETGVVQRPWAKRLLVRGFIGDLDKEVPSDPLMKVPYGEISAARRASGVLLRYESTPFSDFSLSAIAGYTYRQNALEDLGSCAYDWVGRCTAVLSPVRGEREGEALDQHVSTHNVLARILLSRPLGKQQQLRLALAPTLSKREGENRAAVPGAIDPLRGRRDLITVVSGLEHQLDLFDQRLQSLAFAKHYLMVAHSQAFYESGASALLDKTHSRFGAGAGLRYRFSDALYAKLSYEWATRLPSPDQLFGDGELIEQNLTLRPESTHNLNFGGTMRLAIPRAGEFRAQLTGFARYLSELIVLFTLRDMLQFNNVDSARSLGVEASAGWTSPARYLQLDGNLTFQDYRNTSTRGQYAPYEGDRIHSRPYLFANAAAQLFARDLLPARDELSLSWRTSYVHAFQVGWESANLGGSRATVPAQFVHTLGLILLLKRGRANLSTAIEVHNLTDQRVYDFFGMQLPGRAIAAKFTIGV